MNVPGVLYIVPTPIGNLEDITLRALRVLREEVDAIACEDTRQTQKLLEHFSIRKPLVSYHEHNEIARANELLDRLQAGDSIALVTDAGTPLVSDPGYRIVKEAVDRRLTVIPLPGPCAAITALSASGLATDDFRFAGFIPAKSGARRRWLANLTPETVIVYESPHRVVDSLRDMTEIIPDRPLVVARELTKLHEEFLRGTAQEVLQRLTTVKGEFTIVIGRAADHAEPTDAVAEVERLERDGMDRMSAIKLAAKRSGLGKREVYRMLEEQGSSRERRPE